MNNTPESRDLSSTKESIKYLRPIIDPQGPAEVALAKKWEFYYVWGGLLVEAISHVRCTVFDEEYVNTTGIPYSEPYALVESAAHMIELQEDRCLQELYKLQVKRGRTTVKLLL